MERDSQSKKYHRYSDMHYVSCKSAQQTVKIKLNAIFSNLLFALLILVTKY